MVAFEEDLESAHGPAADVCGQLLIRRERQPARRKDGRTLLR